MLQSTPGTPTGSLANLNHLQGTPTSTVALLLVGTYVYLWSQTMLTGNEGVEVGNVKHAIISTRAHQIVTSAEMCPTKRHTVTVDCVCYVP